MKKVNLFLTVLMFIGLYVNAQETGTFSDRRDGKIYKWVKIVNQVWMAENLAYKADSGCWAYGNEQSNVAKYGYLYNWETAQNVCPDGWHLPRDSEWKALEIELGMTRTEANTTGWRSSIGNLLKSETGWNENGNGTNESGFSAFPSGYFFPLIDGYYDMGSSSYWWSNTECSSTNAWVRNLSYDDTGVNRLCAVKENGYSVRCVKDY